jgi:transposase
VDVRRWPAARFRCFSRLRQFRAVATRYGKRDYMYQGTVDVASIRIWLGDPVA